MPSVRARFQMDKKAICSIGMAAYLGERNLDQGTVYGRTGNLTPAWDGVLKVIFASNEETWQKVGAKDGFQDWWSDYEFGFGAINSEYWAWKADKVGHVRLHELTGYMRGQMTGKTGDHYEYRGMTSMEMGSDNPTHPGEMLAGGSGINVLDPPGEDITSLQSHVPDLEYISPYRKQKIKRPAHTIFRFPDNEVDEICEQILDHVTHARRLKRPWRVMPSTSKDPMRQGHYVQRRVRNWGG
jgi:hypothetical protein